MAGIGLADGTRIAVIGAGPSGAGFASALLASARAFGRRIELVLYDGSEGRAVAAPALLDVDTRYRLASLGAPVPLRQGAFEAQALLITGGGRTALLEAPPGGLWVLDGAAGAPGSRIVRQVLTTAASLRGAEVRPWRVDAVVRAGPRWVVRAQGRSENYDLVVGAFGADSSLSGGWLDGAAPPPRKLGAHARLGGGPRDDLLRLYLAPSPEIELLLVVPSPSGEPYAAALGDEVEPSTLARTLAQLARDGTLPGPVEIHRIERFAAPAGAARTTGRGTAISLGAAALGGVLQPGLLPALVAAMRVSNAVLEAGASPGLEARASRALAELSAHARRQGTALAWARRAGARAPDAIARVAGEGQALPSGTLPVLGLPNLEIGALISELRSQALRRMVVDFFSRPRPAEPAEPSPSLVYVVDDDPDARAVLADYLQQRGARVRAFGDELALLEAAARERPGAILLDVVLRWVDGFSLCRALRSHPATARSRLISMSGLNRRSDREAALAAGADAFLPKPIDLAELQKVLPGVLSAGETAGSVARAGSG